WPRACWRLRPRLRHSEPSIEARRIGECCNQDALAQLVTLSTLFIAGLSRFACSSRINSELTILTCRFSALLAVDNEIVGLRLMTLLVTSRPVSSRPAGQEGQTRSLPLDARESRTI